MDPERPAYLIIQDSIDAVLAEAGDLMPLEFSTWTDDYVPGPVWQGMIDWVDGVKPIEDILVDIQAAREAHDAQSAG